MEERCKHDMIPGYCGLCLRLGSASEGKGHPTDQQPMAWL